MINHEESSFDRISAKQSTEIYQQLTQGKVILKQDYKELQNSIEENPLFTLLFNKESHFSSLYQHIGYQLAFNNEGDFYYLRELLEQGVDEANTNAFKIQVVLLLIGRYFSGTGRNLELLFTLDVGLDEKDIDELKTNNEYAELLKTARFTKGWDEALGFLEKRNFAFKTGLSSYFISDAGKAFLLQLVELYESD